MATNLIAGTAWTYSLDGGTTEKPVNGIQTAPEIKEEKEELEVTAINHTTRQYRDGMDSPSEFVLEMQDLSENGALDADQEGLITAAQSGTEGVIFKQVRSNGRTSTFTAQVKTPGDPGGSAPDLLKHTVTVRRTSGITWTSPTA